MKTFFFLRALALVSLVLGLGLEHSCPWPRECLSSERLSLALASDFFCVLGLGLEPCVLDSTSVLHIVVNKFASLKKALGKEKKLNQKPWLSRELLNLINKKTNFLNRGGVEDTRLEAKAKKTKKSEAKAKDSLSEDKPSQGQGQKCSRPRTKETSASVLQKKGLQNIFSVKLKCFTDWGFGGGPPTTGGFGGLGAKPPAVGQFFGKKSYFNAIGSHFAKGG